MSKCLFNISNSKGLLPYILFVFLWNWIQAYGIASSFTLLFKILQTLLIVEFIHYKQ